MKNFKISTSIVNNIPKMGIIDASTFEEIVPFEYHYIIKIKNHKDLSLSNSEDIYILFEDIMDHHLDLCKFCFIPDGEKNMFSFSSDISDRKAIISKNKYSNLFFFYKGLTICKINNKEVIIDLDEDIIRGPFDDIFEIQRDLEDNFRELIRINDDVKNNYSYEKDVYGDSGLVHFDFESTFLVEVEEVLGIIHTRYCEVVSLFDYLGDFNAYGLCLYKDGNKFGFLNRYLFVVGNDFDYVFNDQELSKIGIINYDPSIKYVEKNHKILKIKFVGNFINEIINQPSLFINDEKVVNYFSERRNDCETTKEQIYCKLDKECYTIDDEDIFGLAKLPFYITNEVYKTSDINSYIQQHNDLFGLIPSSYVVLDEIQSIISKIQYNLIPFKDGDKYGYKNHFQELIVPCIYDYADPVINRFGAVKLNDKWGLINGNFDTPLDASYEYGKLVAECIYDSTGDFSEGLLSVFKDGKWGFIDSNGNIIIPIMYDKVKGFSEGFAAISLDGKASFIDKKGELLCHYMYDEVDTFENGYSNVYFNGKHGMINRQGQEATMLMYDQPLVFSEGLFLVKLDGKVGCITEEWDWAVENIYDIMFPFSEELAVVVLNGKYGYVDKFGNVIIPIEFTDAYDFKSGIARVFKDGKFGYIDKKGETIIPFIFDDAGDFVDGFATVKLNVNYGLINSKGEVKIPFSYDYIDPKCFSDGLVGVVIMNVDWEKKCGYINQSGKIVIGLQYSNAYTFIDGIAPVTEYNSLDQSPKFIDSQGNEYWSK
jgi:hypothetical protein